MPEPGTPRSTKKRRLQNNVSPPSVNRTIASFDRSKVPRTPVTPPPPSRRRRPPPSSTSAKPGGSPSHTSADTFSIQIYDLFSRLDDFRESLTISYEAERKARKEAHDATQGQLTEMQDLIECLAADFVRIKRRERMGVMELGLFGANGVVTPYKNKNKGGGEIEDIMADGEEEPTEGDVDMEDIDDSQSVERGLDESSTTLSSRRPGPIQVGLQNDGKEEVGVGAETEDDSLPVIRAGRRRHVSQTISPKAPPQQRHDGSTTESDTPAEDASETVSERALKRSLQLGTRMKMTQPPKQLTKSVADSQGGEVTEPGAQKQDGDGASQIFSQYSYPPNPGEQDDDTYVESSVTTTEREAHPVEQQARELPDEIEYDLSSSSSRRQRPHRKAAQVGNYFDWDRYLVGRPVTLTPAQKNDKEREPVRSSLQKRGARNSSSSPEVEITESRQINGRSNHGKKHPMYLEDSTGEVIIVKTRRI